MLKKDGGCGGSCAHFSEAAGVAGRSGGSIGVHTGSVNRQGERLAPRGVPWLQVCGMNMGIVLGGVAPHWFLRSHGASVSGLPRFYSDPSQFKFARVDFRLRLRTLVEMLGE